MDKSAEPSDADLQGALGSSFDLWEKERQMILDKNPEGSGICIPVSAEQDWKDIDRLIDFKLAR